jgi:hypothetical protein
MASFKKLSKSDVTLVPYYANKQWDLIYCPYPTSSEYLTIYNGTNLTGSFSFDDDPITEGQYDRLIYSQINQLFYQKYTASLDTSSLANSIYYESASQQRPTQSYFIYNDSDKLIENFPTNAMGGIRVLAINQDIFGNKVLPNHFQLSSSAYYIADDGYGNLYDLTGPTGSKNYTTSGDSYGTYGVRLFNSESVNDGCKDNNDSIEPYISWEGPDSGGTYNGTFWANPVPSNKTGRLNYTGLWSAEDVNSIAKGTLTFTIGAPSTKTYYLGIGCDNIASVYIDNTLTFSTLTNPDNYRYWNIYPIILASGSHVVKLEGINNDDNPNPLGPTPGLMGIEIYNNTFSQLSASIATASLGSSTPSGLNILYSSKDHLTEATFSRYDHVGNIYYAHGLGIITDQKYQSIFPLPPIAKNDYGSFLTTDTKTISASLNDYARSGTLNTSSLAFSGSTSGPGYSWATGSNGTIILTTTIPGTYSVWYTIGADIAGSCATQLRSNKAKVTAVVTEPTTTTTTTTSTTTSTTTAEPTTTTTSTTTSTTTAEPTTTTTSTTTSTTTAEPTTTTTSTTTSTTTMAPNLFFQYQNTATGTGNQTWEVEYSTGSFANAETLIASNDVTAGAPTIVSKFSTGPLGVTSLSPSPLTPINVRVRKTSTANMAGNTTFSLAIDDGTGFSLLSGFSFNLTNNPIGTLAWTDITTNLSNPGIYQGYKIKLEILETDVP